MPRSAARRRPSSVAPSTTGRIRRAHRAPPHASRRRSEDCEVAPSVSGSHDTTTSIPTRTSSGRQPRCWSSCARRRRDHQGDDVGLVGEEGWTVLDGEGVDAAPALRVAPLERGTEADRADLSWVKMASRTPCTTARRGASRGSPPRTGPRPRRPAVPPARRRDHPSVAPCEDGRRHAREDHARAVATAISAPSTCLEPHSPRSCGQPRPGGTCRTCPGGYRTGHRRWCSSAGAPRPVFPSSTNGPPSPSHRTRGLPVEQCGDGEASYPIRTSTSPGRCPPWRTHGARTPHSVTQGRHLGDHHVVVRGRSTEHVDGGEPSPSRALRSSGRSAAPSVTRQQSRRWSGATAAASRDLLDAEGRLVPGAGVPAGPFTRADRDLRQLLGGRAEARHVTARRHGIGPIGMRSRRPLPFGAGLGPAGRRGGSVVPACGHCAASPRRPDYDLTEARRDGAAACSRGPRSSTRPSSLTR